MKAFYRILFLASLTTIMADSFGQKEASNWYFGDHMGMKFTPAPQGSSVGQTNTLEGTSSISDRNGNLLFYTDGVTIWNRNHIPMPNGTGLLGFNSSTHSALILRKPGSETIYYVFTADGTSSALNHHMENGYRYSVVDMTLQGGLGDVTNEKNVLLYAPSTEKLAAVKQADGVNYWLMTHEWNSNRFLAYSLTCDGLNLTPVVSATGEYHEIYNGGASMLYFDAIGQMKFSPDGTKLVQVIQGRFRAQLLDFNSATGEVTNPVNILAYWPDAFLQPDQTGFDFEDLYGAEFSPNGKMLYLTKINHEILFQYDITSGDSYSISATGRKIEIGPWCEPILSGWSCPGSMGALQLGPDGKIYTAYRYHNGLNVISKPNNYGEGMEYVQSPVLPGISNYGLPSFAASYFNPFAIDYTSDSCRRLSFSTNYSQAVGYEWHFGDTASSENSSTLQQPVHQYELPGTYSIQLVLTNANGCTDTLNKTIILTDCTIDTDTLSFKPEIVVPNVLTPNNDDINEAFFIQNLEFYPENSLSIVNRWGTVIFSAENYSNSNPFTGENCTEGVYFYKLSIPEQNILFSGFLTILK